jgi:branched-chain amino acid transport system permease protein
MPSASLIAQSLLAGLLAGALYALVGLGISLAWGLLRVINLAHFAFVFLAAYLAWQLASVQAMPMWLVIVITLPVFFLLGVALQWLFTRFEVDEFGSLLVTFGATILIESLIQWIWTADVRRMETPLATASVKLGVIHVPVLEGILLIVTVVVTLLAHLWLRRTWVGKALRASAQNPSIAAAFGVDHRRLAALLAGVSAATGALAGVFVALGSPISPSQMYGSLGVVLSAVILGGLGNPLGLLAASLLIGLAEALTMALTAPSWAPLASFSLLILILVLRPDRV